MATILIVGKGGFGDMMPLWGLAAELQQRGHHIAAAAERHHGQACRALDIEHIPLTGAADPLAAVPDTEIKTLLPRVRDADLLLGNQLASATALLGHLSGTPWVYCAASPLAIPSRHDPPYWPVLQRLQRRLPHSALCQQGAYRLARTASRLAMHAQQRQRRRFGLRDGAHPRFEAFYSPWLNLLMTTPELVTPQPDWPSHTLVTGFCAYQPPFLGDTAQRDALRQFAFDGPAPLLIAPGGSDRTQPERLVNACLDACRRLEQRAVVVLGPRFRRLVPDDSRFLAIGYMPYPSLLEPVRAVIHSGGIGALGWALSMGKPSLLLPSEWDQFDNARRATVRGFALALPAHAGGQEIAGTLSELLKDEWPMLADRAGTVAAERGAITAADAIERLLEGTTSPSRGDAKGQQRYPQRR